MTIRELSALDDRLLRDIGIAPDQISDVVDAMLSRGRDLRTTDPVNRLSDSTQQVLVPVLHRPPAI